MKPRVFSWEKISIACAVVIAIASCSQVTAPGQDELTGGPSGTEILEFSHESGQFEEEILVSLATYIAGGSILFTTDGTDPDPSSETYSGPIEIPADESEIVIRAAVKLGNGLMTKILEKRYTVKPKNRVATPKLSPKKGTYDHEIEVTIACATENAVIRFTLDGSKPGPDSAVYGGPVKIRSGSDVTVKAAAYRDGLRPSSLAIGRYIVTGQPVDEGDILFVRSSGELEADSAGNTRVSLLYRVDPAALSPVQLTSYSLNAGEGIYRAVGRNYDWSHDRGRVVFSYYLADDWDEYDIRVMNADGTNMRTIFTTDSVFEDADIEDIAWSPDGTTIAFIERNYYGQFLRLTDPDGNDGRILVEAVNTDENNWTPPFYLKSLTWSRDSQKIMYVRDGDLWLINVDGSGNVQVTNTEAVETTPDWSPTADRIVFSSGGIWGFEDVYTMNADGSDVRLLTDGSKNDYDPVWSPDGTRIAYISSRDTMPEIFIMNADGSGKKVLLDDPDGELHPAW